MVLETLCNAYPDDLPQGKEFYLEVLQYADFFDQLCTVHTKKKDESTALWKYRLLYESGSASAFPNVEVCYRIYLCLMVTNCGGERSFSVLKRVKSACRATMRQERLQSLGLLCIESEILRSLNFDDIVQDFSNKKSRRHRVTSNCVVSSWKNCTCTVHCLYGYNIVLYNSTVNVESHKFDLFYFSNIISFLLC